MCELKFGTDITERRMNLMLILKRTANQKVFQIKQSNYEDN